MHGAFDDFLSLLRDLRGESLASMPAPVLRVLRRTTAALCRWALFDDALAARLHTHLPDILRYT